MDNHTRARALSSELELDRVPVALAFADAPPNGVSETAVATPSACTFWRLAERSLFYAPAGSHYECPVGAITMGFELLAEHQSAAQQLVATMVELGYFGEEEVPHLPSVGKPHAGILYGPLEQFPIEPDVVLAITSPRQSMILAEAGEIATLSEASGMTTMGRPACAAVARTQNSAEVTLSLGCIGARTYAEVPEDRGVVVLPGAHLDRIIDRLPQLNRANEALADFHRGRKAQFAPSVTSAGPSAAPAGTAPEPPRAGP